MKPKIKKSLCLPTERHHKNLIIVPPLRLYQNVTNFTKEKVNIDIIKSELNFGKSLLEPNNFRYLKFNEIKTYKNSLLKRYYFLGVGFIC